VSQCFSKKQFLPRVALSNFAKCHQAGFTLVELMVTVGIIGILASLTISNFSKYQAKARQTEAKLALGAVFALEKSFYSEYSAYIADFDAIGYTPEGLRRFYAIGWKAATTSGNVTGFQSGAGTSYYPPVNSPSVTCASPCLNFTTQGTWCWAGVPLPADVDPQTFTVQAFGQIDHLNICGNGDGWSINELRILQNNYNGL
jgi:prepilin-type N-terminal cleavage/methylation domain-containing protein